MQRAIALVIGVALIVVGLAACGGYGSGSGSPNSSATPRVGY